MIDGAGLIGSHLVDQLLAYGVQQVRVYDNFSRGVRANLEQALKDNRCEFFADGGDILHKEILLKNHGNNGWCYSLGGTLAAAVL